jgi:hypothetical protein
VYVVVAYGVCVLLVVIVSAVLFGLCVVELVIEEALRTVPKALAVLHERQEKLRIERCLRSFEARGGGDASGSYAQPGGS